MESDWIVIGKVVKPHGLNGEIKVRLLTDFPERFSAGRRILLKTNGADFRSIRKSRVEGEFVYLALDTIDSAGPAAELTGAEFVIPAEELAPANEGFFYPFQLIGLDVLDESGEKVGIVSDVFLRPGQSFLEVRSLGKEYLLPASREFIRSIEIPERRIRIRNLNGLFD